MKITLKNADKIRFTEKGHKHEMLIDGRWTTVPGCSSVAGMFDDKGWMGWWASGQALAPFGWKKLEKDGSNQEEVNKAALEGLHNIFTEFYGSADGLVDTKGYAKFLDKCYRAHAKETKDTAEAGTELHGWLEDYVKVRIKVGLYTPGQFAPIPRKFEPQLMKFIAWEEENQVEWLASEAQVGSFMWQYCGILDYLARINGRVTLGDFKTSKAFKDNWIPQLVGLKQALSEMGVEVQDIAVTRLSREGEFEHRVIEVDHETELLAFLKAKNFFEARNLFNYRRKQAQEIFPDPVFK